MPQNRPHGIKAGINTESRYKLTIEWRILICAILGNLENIDRKLFEAYIAEIGAANVADALEAALRKPAEFFRFVSGGGSYDGGGILLHGSSRHIETKIIPKNGNIYGTDSPTYALFMSLLDLQPRGVASVSFTRDAIRLSINLGFINGRSRMRSGFVYFVPSRQFLRIGIHEFLAKGEVYPLAWLRIVPQDLTAEIVLSKGDPHPCQSRRANERSSGPLTSP